jgi:hypothetical protein
MGSGVEDWEAVETLRRGVGVDTAFGSFFLWERVPLLVRLVAAAVAGTVVFGVARTAGVVGVEMTGWEVAGSDDKASKSDKWFAKVFWD